MYSGVSLVALWVPLRHLQTLGCAAACWSGCDTTRYGESACARAAMDFLGGILAGMDRTMNKSKPKPLSEEGE